MDEDDGGTFVAGAAGQVAERADQVGELARRGALGDHLALEIAVLGADARGDGVAELLAAETCEVVVCQIFEFQLVGRAYQAVGKGRRDHRVGELPDLAFRVLEGSVAVHHHFHVLARGLEDAFLDVQHQRLAVAREELDGALGGLVGAEETVALVVAAAFYGGVEDIVQPEHYAGAEIAQDALGAGAGVDVAGDDGVGIVEDASGAVAENDLHISAAVADDTGVILDIVHSCEFMDVGAEELAVAVQRQQVRVGVDPMLVQPVETHQLVAHLVGRVGEHEDYLPASHRDTLQADGEAVAAEDGEDDADGLAAGLGTHVLRYGGNGGVIPLRTCYDGLGDADDVAVTEFESFFLSCFKNAGGHYFSEIVALADDGAADTAGHGPDPSFVILH